MSSRQKVVPMEVVKAEKELLSLLRYGRSDVRGSELNGVAGDMLSREIPRGVTLRNVLWLLYDMQKGGAKESRPGAFAQGVVKFVESLYPTKTVEFGKEWVEEQTTEGTKNVREIEFDTNPSHVTLFNLETAHREYMCEAEDYLRAARARVTPPFTAA